MDFAKIKEIIKLNNEKLDDKPYFDTEKGIWGPSQIDICHDLFKKINLEKYKHLVDLGSGDGRVVAVAGLFTKATGIEYDPKLHQIALEMKEHLNNSNNLNFLQADFNDINFSKYDCIFAFYDQFFSVKLELKIKQEFTGDLFMYQGVFKPQTLKFVKIIWINQIPIYHYTTKN